MLKRDRYLNLHGFWPKSEANGPGQRAVIWLQGCSIRCPGCFNTDAQAFNAGNSVEVEKLFRRIINISEPIEGVTISGGEPLDQRRPLLALLKQIRENTYYSIILFTGYTWEEIQFFPETPELLACIDVIIAGRFNAERRIAANLIGSTNKTLHFITGRYNLQNFSDIPVAEIKISTDGIVSITGIDPLLIK